MSESLTVFTWAIKDLEREVSDGFVFTAHYTVKADNGVYAAGAYGSVGLSRPAVLIPFDQLTEDLITNWVKTELDSEVPGQVSKIESALQAQLDEKSSPTKENGLPW